MKLCAEEKYYLMKEIERIEKEYSARLRILDTIPDHEFDHRNIVIQGLTELADKIIQKKKELYLI